LRSSAAQLRRGDFGAGLRQQRQVGFDLGEREAQRLRQPDVAQQVHRFRRIVAIAVGAAARAQQAALFVKAQRVAAQACGLGDFPDLHAWSQKCLTLECTPAFSMLHENYNFPQNRFGQRAV
jgi:hypothetical protein